MLAQSCGAAGAGLAVHTRVFVLGVHKALMP